MNEIEKMAHKLKLSHVKSSYKHSISEAMDKQASYEEFLKIILSNELKTRESNGVNRRIRTPNIHTVNIYMI